MEESWSTVRGRGPRLTSLGGPGGTRDRTQGFRWYYPFNAVIPGRTTFTPLGAGLVPRHLKSSPQKPVSWSGCYLVPTRLSGVLSGRGVGSRQRRYMGKRVR